MSGILRRISTARLVALCASVIAVIALAAVGAAALEAGPVPARKPLAQALYAILHGAHPPALSARVTYSDHLFEGASLSEGGQGGGLASSPLVKGAGGRIWISGDHLRIDLESSQGDTEIVLAAHELTIYDVAANSVYRLSLPQGKAEGPAESEAGGHHGAGGSAPTLAQIESALARISRHVQLSGAQPIDVSGRAAYMVQVAPKEGGSLIGELQLAFDATYGTPLRTALYATGNPTPALELALSEVSYAPIAEALFKLPIPSEAKVVELNRSGAATGASTPAGPGPLPRGSGKGSAAGRPTISRIGSGITAVLELKAPAKAGASGSQAHSLGGERVSFDGVVAHQLATELGTILTFERNGYEYVFAGALQPAALQAAAAHG
ncbi:MAG TPA: hypothetical protein VKU89_10205 [Solirubrobacteraceae bacterium]|nr:hypothetical protein [Solirubrobacteraceae bacterium]